MSSDQTNLNTQSGDDESSPDDPQLILFMEAGRDRELLEQTFEKEYVVATSTTVKTLDTEFDCCIFDAPQFNRVAGTVQSKRATTRPDFLPFVLLVTQASDDLSIGQAWEYVDDIIEMPVKKAALRARIRNLVQRRRTSVRLAERKAKLRETVTDLQLKERAMDEAPIGISITDPAREDNPLIYVNEQFQNLTGYTSDVIGTNCRLLQGEETDPNTRATVREAIDAEDSVSVDILNYRKNRQKFWNKLDIAPLNDDSGEVTHFVGFQTDITDRKIKERRLEVLNRVLSHNLRNKMNIIEGHASLLWDEVDDERALESISQIENAAKNLGGLAEDVRLLERALVYDGSAQEIDLQERLEETLSGFEDRYPSATISLILKETDDYPVAVPGLMTALSEAIDNAITHNENPEPQIEIRVERSSSDWIEIEIEDDGPGISHQSLNVLSDGESSLEHADRLGLWLIYLIVTRAGGYFTVLDGDPQGTVLSISVPASTN